MVHRGPPLPHFSKGGDGPETIGESGADDGAGRPTGTRPRGKAGASGPFNRAGHDRWGETSSFPSTQQVWGRRMPIACFFSKRRPRGKKKQMEIKTVNKSSDGFWFHTGSGEGPAQGGRGPTSRHSWGPGAGPRRGPPLPLRRTPSTHVHTCSSSRAWPATSDLLWVVATHSARSSAQG